VNKERRKRLVKKIIDAINSEIDEGEVSPIDLLGIIESMKAFFLDERKYEIKFQEVAAEGMFQ
jgi:hypothetical protein